MPLHTNTCTYRRFYAQPLSHTDAFAQQHLNTQTLLHTDAFTHTDTFTHTDAFTRRRFYTPTLLHRRFYTAILLHTDAFDTHRRFYTHRRFSTQTPIHTALSHTDAFYTQTLLHIPQNCIFTFVFDDRPSFRAKGLRGGPSRSQF